MAEMHEAEATESCGCVFCDLGLEPDNSIDGRPVHTHGRNAIGYSFCSCDEATRPVPDKEK